MNSKYLNKNEKKYFEKLLKDIQITKNVNDVIDKLKVVEKKEITPEIKDFLIQQIDDKNKNKTKIENIDETFKTNLLSIMTIKDYDEIKNNNFFSSYNKNLININFERFKKYIKEKYIKINIDEFIPILKYFLNNKQLEKTDNLIEKIQSDSNDILKDINDLKNYYINQLNKINTQNNKDLSEVQYTKEFKERFNREAIKYKNIINNIIEKIEKFENSIETHIEAIDEKINSLDSEIAPLNKSNLVEVQKNFYLRFKKIEKIDYYENYNKNREDIIKDFVEKNSSDKIKNMFNSFLENKNEIKQSLNEKKINEKEKEKVEIFMVEKQNEIIDSVKEKTNENETINIIVKNNNFLEKIKDNIDEMSTREQTEIGTEEKPETFTQKQINFLNLKTYILNLLTISDKNIDILDGMLLDDYENFKINVKNNIVGLDIHEFDLAKKNLEKLYYEKIKGNAKKYTTQFKEILIKYYKFNEKLFKELN